MTDLELLVDKVKHRIDQIYIESQILQTEKIVLGGIKNDLEKLVDKEKEGSSQ